MAEITAALVKELRETSGAGMMDCKRALTETAGNLQDAVDWLRKKGLAAAAKKAGRGAAEGQIVVLVGLESAADAGKLAPVGRQLAMHVAAANPQSLSIADVDPAALERERNVLAEQARASGRPEEIIAKMVEGRLRKYYEDVVLLEQLYVIDGESRVKAAVEKAGREAGGAIKVTGFVRLVLGEGVEREQKDFAAEVAAQLGA